MKPTTALSIDVFRYRRVVFFTGAGMSAESGIPTYRGQGGTWAQYRWQDYACQRAFELDPNRVLDFHEARRRAVLACSPHAGHRHLALLQQRHPELTVVTQNVDGLHQRGGADRVVELHGSLWRLRCPRHGPFVDAIAGRYRRRRCEHCAQMLRPDITWFGDLLDTQVWETAESLISRCDLFVSVGTSGVVWPAAGLAGLAAEAGAYAVEINLEDTEASPVYAAHVREAAATALPSVFPLSPPRLHS